MDRTDQLWYDCLTLFNIESGILLHQSDYDAFRRVYVANGYVYKVVASRYQSTGDLRAQSLAGEYAILKHCADIKEIPSVIAYYRTDDYEVLMERKLPGERAADLDISCLRLLMILSRLSIIILRLSWRGISHNDIFLHNVLVAPGGSVYLIDFDQATQAPFWAAIIRQFTGISICGQKVHGSLSAILEQYIKEKLSPRTRRFLKKLRLLMTGKRVDRIAVPPDDPSSQLKT